MTRILTVVMISAIAGAAAAPMMAPSSARAAPEIIVKVGDLDLTTPKDQAILEHRLDKAARELCAHVMFLGTRVPNVTYCRMDVRAEAKEALDGGAPQFLAVARTALHQGD
jgi:UrcA family protein